VNGQLAFRTRRFQPTSRARAEVDVGHGIIVKDILDLQLADLLVPCPSIPDQEEDEEEPIVDDLVSPGEAVVAASAAGPRGQCKDRPCVFDAQLIARLPAIADIRPNELAGIDLGQPGYE